MKTFEMNIFNKKFLASSEKDLNIQVNTLFMVLKKLDDNKLTDGFSFQVGWTIYYLSEKSKNYFEILAPDFIKDPFKNRTNDLTLALWVQLEQIHLLRQLNINGETTKFNDKVVLSKNVLKQDKIYLQRQSDVEKGDSGWYIGMVEESSNEEEIYAIYAYELLTLRPELIKVLSLPEEYLIVFEGANIETILNSENEEMKF